MKPKKSQSYRQTKARAHKLLMKAASAQEIADMARRHLKMLKAELRQARKAYKQAKKAVKRTTKDARTGAKLLHKLQKTRRKST